jgi:hypothetical protein
MREEGLCKEECAKKLWEQEGEEKEELLNERSSSSSSSSSSSPSPNDDNREFCTKSQTLLETF